MAPRTRLQAGRSSSLRERLRAHPECGYLFGLQELPPTLMASLFNRFRCSLFSGSEALHARPLHSGRRFVDENDNEDFALQLVTGSAKLDRHLQGGIETAWVTEILVDPTMCCNIGHSLCVTCQLPFPQGGGEGKALYIDVAGSFRPEIVMQVAADQFGLHRRDVLHNITYINVARCDAGFVTGQEVCDRGFDTMPASDAEAGVLFRTMLEMVLPSAPHLIETARYALLVVDLSGLQTDPATLPPPLLAEFRHSLTQLADVYGLACVTTDVARSAGGRLTDGPYLGVCSAANGRFGHSAGEEGGAAHAGAPSTGATTLYLRHASRYRWEAVRNAVRARAVIVYWLRVASERVCAPGGEAYMRDIKAFADAFAPFLSDGHCSTASRPKRAAPRSEWPDGAAVERRPARRPETPDAADAAPLASLPASGGGKQRRLFGP